MTWVKLALKTLDRWLFGNAAALSSIHQLRLGLAVIAIVCTILEFDAEVLALSSALTSPWLLPQVLPRDLVWLKAAVLLTATAVIFLRREGPVFITFAAAYLLLLAYDDTSGVNAANVPLRAMALLLGAKDAWTLMSRSSNTHPQDRAEREQLAASFILVFSQVMLVTMYLQGLLSKLRASGWAWFDGARILDEAGTLGMTIGERLSHYPWVFPIFGALTAVVEGGIPVLYMLGGRLRLVLVLVAISFHLGCFLMVGVSFWRLWVLYPVVFLPWSQQRPVEPR